MTAQPLTPGGVRVTIGSPAAIMLPPRVLCARLSGMLFETDKTFLLPSGLDVTRSLRKFHDRHPGMKVLIVGHADTSGDASHNLALSEERARSIAAFLHDDVEYWLGAYEQSRGESLLWGATEDAHMAGALGFAGVADYRAARGLAPGASGRTLREPLVREYLTQDGTSLPAETPLVTHGCGEFHPEVPTGDGVSNERNRRVEAFLFEPDVDPPPRDRCPPGGCPEYPIWRGKTILTVDLAADLGRLEVLVVDQNGAPVPSADVHLSGPLGEDGKADDQGVARFEEIVPGEYEVFARKDGFESGSARVVVLPGNAPGVPLPASSSAASPSSSSSSSSSSFAPDGGASALDGDGGDGTLPVDGGGKTVVQLKGGSISQRVNKIEVESLTFLTDHQTPGGGKILHRTVSRAISTVNGGTTAAATSDLLDSGAATPEFTKPDWTPSKSDPVSYTMGRFPQARLRLAFDIVPGPALMLQAVTAILKNPADTWASWSGTPATPLAMTGVGTVDVDVAAGGSLPTQVGVVNGGEVTWVLHIDGQDFHPAKSPDPLVSGPHKVYVTLGTPTGQMDKDLAQTGPEQIITEARLAFVVDAATGTSTTKGALDAIFDVVRAKGARFAGHHWWKDKGNDTGVLDPLSGRHDDQPPLHDYLWMCMEHVALGECEWLAGAFVLIARALGISDELEVGLAWPWPSRLNRKGVVSPPVPDEPAPSFPEWPLFPVGDFQGRYESFAVTVQERKYARVHTDFHPTLEFVRFHGGGILNKFEGVARFGHRLYPIGEQICEADDTIIPGVSSLSEDKQRDASATIFYAKGTGSSSDLVKSSVDLKRGDFRLQFLIIKHATDSSKDNTKCDTPYGGFPEEFHFED